MGRRVLAGVVVEVGVVQLLVKLSQGGAVVRGGCFLRVIPDAVKSVVGGEMRCDDPLAPRGSLQGGDAVAGDPQVILAGPAADLVQVAVAEGGLQLGGEVAEGLEVGLALGALGGVVAGVAHRLASVSSCSVARNESPTTV